MKNKEEKEFFESLKGVIKSITISKDLLNRLYRDIRIKEQMNQDKIFDAKYCLKKVESYILSLDSKTKRRNKSSIDKIINNIKEIEEEIDSLESNAKFKEIKEVKHLINKSRRLIQDLIYERSFRR